MKKTIIILIVLMMAYAVKADLELDRIQFDPAIIAAGDEVDIVIQFHDTSATDQERIGNVDYSFKVILEPDDRLTRDYVIVQDEEGDNVHGTIFTKGYYNKKFRVKVSHNAPAGNYEFKLVGRWYKNGQPEGYERYMRFSMPVKKEGIILDVSNLVTVPKEIRPGDDYVRLMAYIENVGEKDAKSVEINVETSQGIEPSYTNNNRKWIGRLNAGESKELEFNIDLDEDLAPGVHEITYNFEYMDLDNNKYVKQRTIPLLVKSRPYLEVVESIGEGYAGEKAKLTVKVKNTGTESAEAVDVRILKQNSQPFDMDVRSDYIGELKPGEEGTAIFEIEVNREAEIKEHNLKLLIRSKGDSDEGDDSIYTYNRRATLNVVGTAPNYLAIYGLIGAGIFVLIAVIKLIFGGKNAKRK